eukprot:72280_1
MTVTVDRLSRYLTPLLITPNMGQILGRMLSVFYHKRLEVALVGLEASGKTTLMNRIISKPDEKKPPTIPTIGLNVEVANRGGLQIKCWDVGGQALYRSEWGRYTRGCDVIIYVVDSAAIDQLSTAKRELHRLLEDRELESAPMLIVANKIDLLPHVSETEMIQELNLDYIHDSPWIVIPISALKSININQVLAWLVKQAQ